LKEEGIGDQSSELQQFSWKIFDGSKLKSSPWGIDMLCEYVDNEYEQMYVWCQGKVVELVRQSDTEAVVKIKWNEACLQPGDPKVTQHVLKKLKWNPQKRRTEDKRCMERRFTSLDKVEYVIIYMCIVVSIHYKNITQETPTKMTNKSKTDTPTTRKPSSKLVKL
jgi:hypothetical protein